MEIGYKRINEIILRKMADLWGEWINGLIIINNDTFPLAAMKGDIPVGYVCVTTRDLSYPLGHLKEAYIESLGVHEDYRRQGIGQQLIYYAEEWATKVGVNQIRTHSNVKATEAINMWYKLNYGLCPHIYYQEEGCEGYYAVKTLSE